MTETPQLCAVIVMGVSGSGKTTIAKSLAELCGWDFEDGDRFHPAANVAKMSSGQPLTDTDREPWLRAIAAEIDRRCATRKPLIVACSALKRSYRRILVHDRGDVRIVYLDGNKQLIADRLAQRRGHFMPAGLLDSQFATLEVPSPDENVTAVSIDAPIGAIASDIADRLGMTKGRHT